MIKRKKIMNYLLVFISIFGFNFNTKASDTLRIAAVGDIMMGSGFPTNLLPADDAKGSFKAVLAPLRGADLTFGNLEGVLLDEGQSKKCKGGPSCYAFRMPERYVNHLVDAGFDAVSTANNHSGDFDDKGHQLRPHIVWFGEMVPALEEAISITLQADYVAVIGTSLQVYPAASLMHYAKPNVPVFYIDPRPASITNLQNPLEVIDKNATEGVPILREKLLRR